MRMATRAAIAALLAASVASPASAALLNFQLTGSQQASFQIDTETVPSFFSMSSLIGNQVRFDNVSAFSAGLRGRHRFLSEPISSLISTSVEPRLASLN